MGKGENEEEKDIEGNTSDISSSAFIFLNL